MDKLYLLLPLIIEMIPKIKQAIRDNKPVIDAIKKYAHPYAPDLLDLLEKIGGVVFPELPPEKKTEIGAVMFDVNSIQWVQDQLNRLGFGPLMVDGSLGPATKAAVMAFQLQHSELVPDGYPGPLTRAKMR